MAEIQDSDAPVVPRLRRSNYTFPRNGVSNSTESIGVGSLPQEEDEPIQAVENLNEIIRNQAVALPAPQNNTPAALSSRDRLAQVRERASDYEREFRLDLLHQMLMVKTPLDEIANELGISISQVRRDRQELYRRLRDGAKDLDIDYIVGENQEFYRQVQSMALKEAARPGMPTAIKLAAMRTALGANADQHRFYQAAGVYQVLQYRKAAGQSAMSDIERMMQMTKQITDIVENPLDGADTGTTEEITL